MSEHRLVSAEEVLVRTAQVEGDLWRAKEADEVVEGEALDAAFDAVHDLRQELQRWQNRAEHVRSKLEVVIGTLDGQWG